MDHKPIQLPPLTKAQVKYFKKLFAKPSLWRRYQAWRRRNVKIGAQ